jgi:hypothetical protein
MRKMSSQTNYIEDLQKKYSDKRIAILPDYGGEVKGDFLHQVADDLYGKGQLVI